MDIDRVIENLREAKKKASCPPGFKYSKKMKSCVPIRKKGKYIGICGQGPSDHSDLADWLLKKNIESMSLNPDTVIDTWFKLAGKKI